ncbi:MAG TPA: HlyD family efflux transporter periplasmic adaptor subunit [Rhodanobacteraceae bacterium]|nr:HlyD family efflux transporter periplasmic adaptor subunit [Rhodanobacteraceae bacterium]
MPIENAASEAQPLPPLRQELTLNPAPAAPDGSPVWTLHDPASNQFYEIGWTAFEILSRWELGTALAVAEAVCAQTTASVEVDDVLELAQFLAVHNLTVAATPMDSVRLAQLAARHKLSVPRWLLKHYLFFRVPLVRPMPFLRRVYPWMAFVYCPGFWWLMLGVLLLGLYLVSQQWESFVHTFHAYTTWRGLLALALALSLAKVLHELGHAFTAYRHGCRIPAMGFALLVMWPVLYTDTGEAWKLKSRRARLQIGAAGVLAELVLAAFALLLWNFLPDGPIRAGVFMLATSTWVLTLAINASPFTRFDGYYLLSDWINVTNLHERTFAIGRWWLRERLFGFGDPPPEAFPQRLHRFLIGLAWVTWLYRFVLFLSIALLVFHFFFRALGIVLMCVEISWFLALPIVREFIVWWRRRGDMRWNVQTVRTCIIAFALAAFLLLPWQANVRAPAVLGQAQAQTVYTPRAAQLMKLTVHDGQQVDAGAVLAQLTSPTLDYQIKQAEQQLAHLQWQVEQQPFDDTLRALGPALVKQRDTARQMLAAYRTEQAQLVLRAPFAGRVVDIAPALHAGEWLKGGEPLLGVVGTHGVKGDAFVGAAALTRLDTGRTVDFVAALPAQPVRHCAVTAIDRVNLSRLDEPYVASIYGGGIASLRQPDGSLAPLESTYRLRFGDCDGAGSIPREMPGEAIIHGDRRSLAGRFVTWLGALMRRQISF